MSELDALVSLLPRPHAPATPGADRGALRGFSRLLDRTLDPDRPGAASRPEKAPGEYIVRRGDTLSGLARRFGTSVERLVRDNGIADRDRIRAGDRLRVAGGGAPPPAAATETAGTPELWSEVHHYEVKPGDTLWQLAVNRFHVKVEDIARQNGISDPSALQPGQILSVQREIDSRPREVLASWYGPGFDGRPMANGQPYDRHAATIAHKELPLGTEVDLTNPANGRSVRAVVTDRGPYVEGREVDLSYGLARHLGIVERGVGRLMMRVRG